MIGSEIMWSWPDRVSDLSEFLLIHQVCLVDDGQVSDSDLPEKTLKTTLCLSGKQHNRDRNV